MQIINGYFKSNVKRMSVGSSSEGENNKYDLNHNLNISDDQIFVKAPEFQKKQNLSKQLENLKIPKAYQNNN